MSFVGDFDASVASCPYLAEERYRAGLGLARRLASVLDEHLGPECLLGDVVRLSAGALAQYARALEVLGLTVASAQAMEQAGAVLARTKRQSAKLSQEAKRLARLNAAGAREAPEPVEDELRALRSRRRG